MANTDCATLRSRQSCSVQTHELPARFAAVLVLTMFATGAQLLAALVTVNGASSSPADCQPAGNAPSARWMASSWSFVNCRPRTASSDAPGDPSATHGMVAEHARRGSEEHHAQHRSMTN